MAKHLKDFQIQSFRGIHHLKLNDLNDINILTGDNNVGKTSILECMNFLSGLNDLFTLINGTRGMQLNIRRELSIYEKLLYLFPTEGPFKDHIHFSFILNDMPYEISIKKDDNIVTLTNDEINDEIKRNRCFINIESDTNFYDVNKMTLTFKKNDEIDYAELLEISRLVKRKKDVWSLVNTIYISPVQHAENTVYLSEIFKDPSLYEEMLTVLKEFDEGILSINIDTLSEYSRSKIFTILSKEHNKAIPLNCYGDGMKKAVLLMSAVIKAKNGILLLDEFETAIHTTAMNTVFEWILKTCIKLNVQLFLTSHSKEAIEKVLKCSPNLYNHINLYTIYKDENQTLTRKLSCQEAIEANDDFGLELR